MFVAFTLVLRKIEDNSPKFIIQQHILSLSKQLLISHVNVIYLYHSINRDTDLFYWYYDKEKSVLYL